MLKGFKDFLLRGNVVDLAVAVVIGAAFTAVVTAFTDAFLKPLIQLFSGGGEFAGKIRVNGVEFDYASFINAAITFLITAAVVYFFVVYPMKWLQERRRRGDEDGPADPTDVELLTEIRDLLRAQAERADRQDALGAGAPPTARLPPRPPEGFQPYPDTPYPEPARPEPSRPEPSRPELSRPDQAYPDNGRPEHPYPGNRPPEPPRRRRHADPRG